MCIESDRGNPVAKRVSRGSGYPHDGVQGLRSLHFKWRFQIELSMGAPSGNLDPDLQVFWVMTPVPGPVKIFSHRSPGSMGQYLQVAGTCRYTCTAGIGRYS
jgi:hypothetical protein